MEESKNLRELKNLLIEYLQGMDRTNPGPNNIFKTEQSKIDLETKVWHCFHKLEAASYHSERVKDISQEVRQELNSLSDWGRDKEANQAKIQFRTEYQVQARDTRILFEIEAFLTASRSALDFIASVISRYIRGTNFDRFKKAVEILKSSSGPISGVVQHAWIDWAKDLINYRDHLIHRGVLFPTIASHVAVSESGSSSAELQKSIDKIPFGQGKPVIFPLPRKPNPRARLTRSDISKSHRTQFPYGVVKREESVEISRGHRKARKTAARYELAPGFVEAEDFCKEYLEKLLDFCLIVFQSINERRFTHLQS